MAMGGNFPENYRELQKWMERRVALLERAMDQKARQRQVTVLEKYVTQLLNAPTLPVSSVSPQPNTLAIRDANGRTQVATPVADQDAANKAYVDQAVGEDTGWVDATPYLISAYEEASPTDSPFQYRVKNHRVKWRGQIRRASSNDTGTGAERVLNFRTVPDNVYPSIGQSIFSIGLSGSAASARAWVENKGNTTDGLNFQASVNANAWDLSGVQYDND